MQTASNTALSSVQSHRSARTARRLDDNPIAGQYQAVHLWIRSDDPQHFATKWCDPSYILSSLLHRRNLGGRTLRSPSASSALAPPLEAPRYPELDWGYLERCPLDVSWISNRPFRRYLSLAKLNQHMASARIFSVCLNKLNNTFIYELMDSHILSGSPWTLFPINGHFIINNNRQTNQTIERLNNLPVSIRSSPSLQRFRP